MSEQKEEQKKKMGRPRIPANKKKKSCNILLTPNEILNLQILASYYSLNKSAFISLLINKFYPILSDYVYKKHVLKKSYREFLEFFSEILKIEPNADNVHNIKFTNRSTWQAELANDRARKDYNEVLKINEDLEGEITRLEGNLKLNDDIYNTLAEQSLKTINGYSQRLDEEKRKNQILQRKLDAILDPQKLEEDIRLKEILDSLDKDNEFLYKNQLEAERKKVAELEKKIRELEQKS